MFILTTEDDAGMWFDDPQGFDTHGEARAAALGKRRPPNGYSRVIYRCTDIEVVNYDTSDATPDLPSPEPSGARMSEYHDLQKEAAEARVGADRMAMGLSCIPDPLRGDMAEIGRQRLEIARLTDILTDTPRDIETAHAEIKRLELEIAAWKQASDLKAAEIGRLQKMHRDGVAYSGEDDHRKSYDACLDAVRERVQAGGETWKPKDTK